MLKVIKVFKVQLVLLVLKVIKVFKVQLIILQYQHQHQVVQLLETCGGIVMMVDWEFIIMMEVVLSGLILIMDLLELKVLKVHKDIKDIKEYRVLLVLHH